MSIFTHVSGLRAKKHAFNLSHQISQTQDIGVIMPCYVHDGILPNSREMLSVSTIVRMQALLAPLQHKVDMYCHYWYLPYRLFDKDFTSFISGEMEREGETYNCPVISLSRVAKLMQALWIEAGGSDSTQYVQADYLLQNVLMNPGSMLVYLNYPSFDEELEGYIDYNYSTADSSFPDTADLIDLNIRRLQAYFFILAQNYFNENFKYQAIIKHSSIPVLDLLDLMFRFANQRKSDLTVSEKVIQNMVSNSNVYEVLLAEICFCLYCGNSTIDPLQVGLSGRFANRNLAFPHAWKKDYFTSSLPFVQLGNEVTIPMSGGSATINGGQIYGQGKVDKPILADSDGYYIANKGVLNTQSTTGVTADGTIGVVPSNDLDATGVPVEQIKSENIEINSPQGTLDFDEIEAGITINELRAANALQRLKEAYARFGTRYQEWLKGFWNQNSSDRSMNLPEWLGGFKVPVQISEIEQNSATPNSEVTGEDTPLGTLAGRGLGVGGKKVFNHHFEEPGVIVGLCFLQPKAVYPTYGIDRFLLKTNNIYDYFTPQMEHLGEQEVYQGELYMRFSADDNFNIFGYQSRYAEYKQIQSKYRGQFASYLKFWHLGREFGTAPVLGSKFVTIDSSTMRRPFAVQQIEPSQGEYVDISPIMIWFNNDVKYIAPMSRFGTPALLN